MNCQIPTINYTYFPFYAMVFLPYVLLLRLLHIGSQKSSRGTWNILLPPRNSCLISANPFLSWQLLRHLFISYSGRVVWRRSPGFSAKSRISVFLAFQVEMIVAFQKQSLKRVILFSGIISNVVQLANGLNRFFSLKWATLFR